MPGFDVDLGRDLERFPWDCERERARSAPLRGLLERDRD
jgi:hypothetical protein